MQLSIAALTLPIVPGNPQVIIACGTFDTSARSLRGQGPWTLNDADGSALVDKANSGIDIVIDYEHQTILSADNGQPAPAAGWLIAGGFTWDPMMGLVATDIRWTTDAADMIREGEYRFISPVFSYADGVPNELMSVALTNTPSLTNLQELAINSRNKGYPIMEQSATPPVAPVVNVPPVLQVQPATAASSGQNSMIAALTNQLTAQNMETLRIQEELESMKRQLADAHKNSIITAALTAGKLMPGMEPWARSMSLEELSNYVTTAKPIVAALTSTQTKGVAPKTSKDGSVNLSQEEIAICKQLGLTHERFIAARTEQGEK